MIFLPHKKLVIVTPFKCGSTSLHNMLCTPKYQGQYVIGPQGDGEIDKHTFHLPYWSKQSNRKELRHDFTLAVVVRNPYERARSIWSQFQRSEGKMDFVSFATNELVQPIARSVSELIDEAGYDRYQFWQIEHIDLCLSSIGITEKAPRDNVGDKYTLSDYERSLVKSWANEDCLRFSYTHECQPIH